MVSTHLKKNISQIGWSPQVGVKINNVWNHHLDMCGRKINKNWYRELHLTYHHVKFFSGLCKLCIYNFPYNFHGSSAGETPVDFPSIATRWIHGWGEALICKSPTRSRFWWSCPAHTFGCVRRRSTWNAKCPIFLGNFTPKTSNYYLKNRALGFPGT